jgi:hypothetical protein
MLLSQGTFAQVYFQFDESEIRTTPLDATRHLRERFARGDQRQMVFGFAVSELAGSHDFDLEPRPPAPFSD